MNIVYAIVVLGVLGALFGLVLSVASKVFEVKKDPPLWPCSSIFFWGTPGTAPV